MSSLWSAGGGAAVGAVVGFGLALLVLWRVAELPHVEFQRSHQLSEFADYDLVLSAGDCNSSKLKKKTKHKVGDMAWVAQLTRIPLVRTLLGNFAWSQSGFGQVRELAAILPDLPMYYPFVAPTPEQLRANQPLPPLSEFAAKALEENEPAKGLFKRYSIADYTSRYRSGELTPTQVAKAVLAAIDKSDQSQVPLRAFVSVIKEQVLQQAEESTKRYQVGKPLGVLDGVLVAIKDELDVAGHPTFVGTSFLGSILGVAGKNAVVVEKLQAAGAVIVGKTNMFEVGAGITGFNRHFGTPRNPYNPLHDTGGSSSGSAAAVSSGLVPLALGVDAGGSVRIPSALCGIVGLKPTFGRVSTLTVGCPSLGHIGPIAGSVRDAAVGYTIISGGHPSYPPSLTQPNVALTSFDATSSFAGIRIGVFREYFNHCSPEILQAADQSIEWLKQKGASVVDVHISHLRRLRAAHAISALSDMVQILEPLLDEHMAEMGPDVQIELNLARSFSARDLIAAQKLRSFAMRKALEMFQEIDVLVTPATAITAPVIVDELNGSGESDFDLVWKVARYMFYGNLVGIPGVVVPIGYDVARLPISMQFQAAHWNEDAILRVAHATEQHFAPKQRQPQVFFDIIKDAKLQA